MPHAQKFIELEVYDSEDEKDLNEIVFAALQQIEEKKCAVSPEAKEIRKRVRKLGFAFQGKKGLIG